MEFPCPPGMIPMLGNRESISPDSRRKIVKYPDKKQTNTTNEH